MSLRAYAGDVKTLLAINLLDKSRAKNLAGITIECRPGGQRPYFLHNTLQFRTPGDHAQDASEPENSSINAPFHKFRWLHVPGSVHQVWGVETGFCLQIRLIPECERSFGTLQASQCGHVGGDDHGS